MFAIGLGLALPSAAAPSEPPSVASPSYLFQLSYEDAEGAIGFALAEKGAGEKVAASIVGKKAEAIFSYNKPISVEIRGLQFDKSVHRWSANLLFVADEQVVSAIPVAGRFEEMIEVPVLKRQVREGEVINKDYIEIRDYALSRTRSDTITDMASMVGKTPSHTISAFRPIREHEIAQMAIVKKDGIVQIRYASPGMEITTTGQALDEGAKGDVINVRNLASKKTVRAVVADENTVNVVTANIQTSSKKEAAASQGESL